MLTTVRGMRAPLVGLQENQTKPGNPHHRFPDEHAGEMQDVSGVAVHHVVLS